MAIWSLGYRPFFLLGALWAAVVMHLWLATLSGSLVVPTAFTPLAWHAHELVYGYLPAIIAGFLLTAVPNWTGRPPLRGGGLAALAALWLAGRIAVTLSAQIGAVPAAIVDVLFLAALAAVVAREIVAGADYRNLTVVALIAVLGIGNAASHFGAAAGLGPVSERMGVAVAIALIGLIGGRIVPAFTRNWLRSRGPGRLPAAFGPLDAAAVTTGLLALVAWIGWPAGVATGALCALAALLHFGRLARWAGERTAAEPLVLILHVGYAFVPLGFAAVAVAILRPGALAPSAALHAWTAGAIGVTTLAVMTRATLGHSGRTLHANAATQLLYVAAVTAAIARVLSGVSGTPPWLLDVAASAWMIAFGGFVLAFGPMLLLPRRV